MMYVYWLVKENNEKSEGIDTTNEEYAIDYAEAHEFDTVSMAQETLDAVLEVDTDPTTANWGFPRNLGGWGLRGQMGDKELTGDWRAGMEKYTYWEWIKVEDAKTNKVLYEAEIKIIIDEDLEELIERADIDYKHAREIASDDVIEDVEKLCDKFEEWEVVT